MGRDQPPSLITAPSRLLVFTFGRVNGDLTAIHQPDKFFLQSLRRSTQDDPQEIPSARYYIFFAFRLAASHAATSQLSKTREGARFCASRRIVPSSPSSCRMQLCNQTKTDYRDIFILETSDIIDRLFTPVRYVNTAAKTRALLLFIDVTILSVARTRCNQPDTTCRSIIAERSASKSLFAVCDIKTLNTLFIMRDVPRIGETSNKRAAGVYGYARGNAFDT